MKFSYMGDMLREQPPFRLDLEQHSRFSKTSLTVSTESLLLQRRAAGLFCVLPGSFSIARHPGSEIRDKNAAAPKMTQSRFS
ncbi:hypothetical protein [Fodinibius roseus]|uniref:hypothetical protein n=1 Tax=Fodinibius roseus TaxID=1194090 RepID=UPI001B8CE7F8|nr:hypothetical protein [Fodinibius roseus]